MKEVGSPVFREDVNQRTLVGLVQGALTPENQCPTRLFNIVDVSFFRVNFVSSHFLASRPRGLDNSDDKDGSAGC